MPNKMQVGFLGVSGIGDVMPWFGLPLDYWDLIGLIPKVGSYIASVKDNIGVNMSSKKALPVGGNKSYSDKRTLININLADLMSDSTKNKLVNKIWGKIPFGKRAIITKLLKEDAAKKLIGKGVGKLASMANISINGDPKYIVDGKIDLNIF